MTRPAMRDLPLRSLRRLGTGAALFAGIAAGGVALAQSARPALFSAAQATRGGAVFATTCATCHGSDLTGGGGAPALQGPDFLAGWSTKTTKDLVLFVSTQRPPGQAHSLTDPQYADICAYILSVNGFHGGATDTDITAPKPIGQP